MSRAGLLGCALLVASVAGLAGCTNPRTETVVIISTSGIRVPEQVNGLRIHIIDKAADHDDDLYDVKHRLCGPGQTEGCLTLPVTMTLFPGSMRPHDSVRVQIDALFDDQANLSNAALFTFSEGQSLRLDFVLYANCLGRLDCSVMDKVCGLDDRCASIAATPFAGEPDLSPVSEDFASRVDASGVDLAPSFHDMTTTTDLLHIDLLGCTPQCSGRTCGDDQCFGSCGTCTGFSYCEPFSGTCQSCGAQGDFCCAGAACKFSLVCDGTNHCVQPMTGMEPPCGGGTQACCPGNLCDPGLQCLGDVHCYPIIDMTPPPMDLSVPPLFDFSMPPDDMGIVVIGKDGMISVSDDFGP
jgi:hypothetical protein